VFEVSERTIKRDISALQQAGLPIFAESGRSGGYRYLDSRTPMPAVSFTAGEAAAIAIALGTQENLPFAPEGSSALSKILHSMSAGDQREVSDLLERVGSTSSPVRNRAARTLDEGIRRRVVVNISYADGRGNTTDRKIDPMQYVQVRGRWYLHAYCHLRQDARWFRLDRVASARLTRSAARIAAETVGAAPADAALLATRWRLHAS
jgi:predicted DNA-binding transcriptional regulator YafY